MESFENINNEELKTKRRQSREDWPVITERSIEEYEALFDVNFAEMKGKTILDIGSGRGNFHDKVSAMGVKIVSLNPEFKRGKESKYAEQILHEQGDVGARAQEMPFADNSFDSEFALYSVPYYLPRLENKNVEADEFYFKEVERVIDEIIRTLKSNSKAYIYPIDLNSKDDSIVKKILEQRSSKASFNFNKFEGNRVLIITKK